jgi:hypothetical protein
MPGVQPDLALQLCIRPCAQSEFRVQYDTTDDDLSFAVVHLPMATTERFL